MHINSNLWKLSFDVLTSRWDLKLEWTEETGGLKPSLCIIHSNANLVARKVIVHIELVRSVHAHTEPACTTRIYLIISHYSSHMVFEPEKHGSHTHCFHSGMLLCPDTRSQCISETREDSLDLLLLRECEWSEDEKPDFLGCVSTA